MRTLLAVLTLLAAVFGSAGGGALLVEARLGRLAPGGVAFHALHYNPFTGAVVLRGVRAFDAAGRVLFSAERMTASVGAAALVGGGLALRRVHLTAPTLALRRDGASALLRLVSMPAALVGPRAGATGVAWEIEGLMITRGSLVVEQGVDGQPPLSIDDIELRLNRLAAAATEDGATAFALEMATYGTVAHLTGSTFGGPAAGFMVRVRAADLDLATLLADFAPVRGGHAARALQDGRADVDVELRFADGRVLASGSVRLGRLHVPGKGTTSARAEGMNLVLDSVDLETLTGRVSRMEILRPVVAVVRAGDGRILLPPTLATLTAAAAGLVVRRTTVTDGTLTLVDRGGAAVLALRGVRVVAQARERDGAPGVLVTARALTDGTGSVELTGLLAPGDTTLEGDLRIIDVPWTLRDGSGLLGFDGRVRLDAGGRRPRLTAFGRATVSELRLAVTDSGRDGLSAESVTLAVRRFEWPALRASFDSVVLVRPAWSTQPPLAWERWGAMLGPASVTIVDGALHSGHPGAAPLLRDVAAAAISDPGRAAVRIDMAAAAPDGRRLSLSRDYPVSIAAPLPTLF
ncbi:MAG: DUF748 domain-containing protein, partial [Candidatus Rokuibacteriota bacterium]